MDTSTQYTYMLYVYSRTFCILYIYSLFQIDELNAEIRKLKAMIGESISSFSGYENLFGFS